MSRLAVVIQDRTVYVVALVRSRVSTEFRRHGIPRNFLTSKVISAQFRRNSAKFRGIPRNFAGIEPEITSVFRGMPKCHFRGHPSPKNGASKHTYMLYVCIDWPRLSTLLQCIGCVVALRINSLVIALHITKGYSLMVVV